MAARGAPVGPHEAVADLTTSAQTARGALVPLAETPILIDEPGFPRVEMPADGSPPRVVVATDRGTLALEPFAGIHDARYCVYFPLAEPDAAARRAELAERDAHALTLDGRTVDRVAFGEQQPEVDHRLRADRPRTGADGGVPWRADESGIHVRVIDPHLVAETLRLTWLDVEAPPFRVEVDGVVAHRQAAGGAAGICEFALAPTDAGWGIREIAIMAEGPLGTPRLRDLRVLRGR